MPGSSLVDVAIPRRTGAQVVIVGEKGGGAQVGIATSTERGFVGEERRLGPMS